MPLSPPVSLSDRRLRVIVWINLVAQIGITVTGALVRLTASGLGCPTWPLCTEDSLISTPEMGIHGLIEFGNRLLTIVILVVSLAVVWALWSLKGTRRDLWRLAVVSLAGIPLQAVVGGISVWTALNPYIVGLHFVLSVVMTTLATILVLSVRDGDRRVRVAEVPPLSWVVGAGVAVTMILGILTTGSGPHAGDADAPRNGLNPELMQHLHSWPAYVTVALVAVAAVRGTRTHWLIVLGTFAAQIAVGIVQSRTGLPVPLVAIHVALAMVAVAVSTTAVHRSATSGSIATARKSAVK